MTTRRIIVHPGFHKTGTSSLQSYCHQNRDALRPYLAFYGKAEFMQAGSAARIYGQKPFPWRLRDFRRKLDRFLASIPDDPVIVLSRETFSGTMPGHRKIFGRRVKAYAPVAVPLGRQIIAALRARFGADVSITFVYTLRETEPWIASVYGHLLRSIHLTEDYATFRSYFPKLRDLPDEAMAIARRLDLTDFHMIKLEDYTDHRLGPSKGLFDLLEVPQSAQDALPQAHRANQGQSADLAAQFLELNRSTDNKRMLKRLKDDLIAKAQNG